MIAEPWDHIKDLFDSALDLPPEERAGFLSQQDPIAADQVAELLASLENSGDFMLQPCCIAYDFLEDLEVDQQRFFPGDVLCGRFHIVSLIGRGGMGEVYKAWDEELEGHVALKTLRLEISTHQLFTSRFRQELQLARKVTHPNVCRIFDSFKHSLGDGTFISVLSMELLPGQTLADYLKTKTRLSTGEALPIVEQIVAGLGAIHAAGIAHRDLKPSNLILVPAALPAKSDSMTDTGKASDTNRQSPINAPAGAAAVAGHPVQNAASADSLASLSGKSQGQQTNSSQAGAAAVTARAVTDPDIESTSAKFIIKITDFGIAGRLPDGLSQAAQTEVSKLLGTPDYMAPEQLEHARANIQSDIYSLGLVLHEMVTGTRPFAEASAWKRISTDSPPPRKLTPDLPDHWNKTIACCLERNPNYRFQTAQAVLDGLEGDLSSAKIPPKPVLVRLKRAVRTRVGAIAIFFLLAMSLSAGVYRYYPWRPKLPAGATVLFPDIENATSDQQLEGITDLMRNQLGSPKFSLLDRSQINAQLQQMGKPVGTPVELQIAREMAWRARTNLLLFGTISQVGNGYTLNVRAEEVPAVPAAAARHWDQDFYAENKERIFNAVQSASRWFRSLTEGLPVDRLRGDALPQSTTTSSWEALLRYSQAERLRAAGQTQKAIDLLHESVNLDHDFSLAYMRLGDLYDSLGEEKKGFEQWQRAIATLARRPVTQKEELRIRGLFAQDMGDFKTAEEAFKNFEILYPHEYLASFYLASTQQDLGLFEDALATMKQAELKQLDAYPPLAYEARLSLVLGKLDDAERAIDKLRSMHREGVADSIEVGLKLFKEDFVGVLATLNRLQNNPEFFYRSKSYSLRAAVLREFGNDNAAIQALKDGIIFDQANNLTFNEADKWIALAYIYWRIQHNADCRRAALKALDLESGRIHLLKAGTLLARASFIKDARRALDMLPPNTGLQAIDQAWHQLHGEILLAQHHDSDALVEMLEARKKDLPANPKEYLARALSAAGNKIDALQIYREAVEPPARLWQALDYQYPGFWLDIAKQYDKLVLEKDTIAIAARTRRDHMEHFATAIRAN